jgi:5-oxoprolinase (ATP-hydrolysing) subunit C
VNGAPHHAPAVGPAVADPAPAGRLRLLSGGLGCSVQDAGRRGLRHQGIAPAGWLDGPLAECANALLGNAPGSACIELRGPGLALQVDAGPVAVALAVLPVSAALAAVPAGSPGAGRPPRPAATLVRADGQRLPLSAFTSATLQPGDQLHCAEPAAGDAAYLAVSGGVQVPMQLGSRATHAGARLGGLDGRLLAAGDTLPCGRLAGPPVAERQAPPFSHGDGPVRVMPGPQAEAFTPEALACFFATDWQASHEQDRMGMRLRGPALAHVNAAAADILSDAVAVGSIQVPANGLPIVLLADGQTVGGYPKIATVISADLPRLAHARAGSTLRFATVDRARALAALAQARKGWLAWAATIAPCRPTGPPDEAALWQANLISGMIDAGCPDPPA